MRKSLKQFLQKSLSGVLCTAMLFSGISVPELSVYAAESEQVQETEQSRETESTEQKSSSVETTSMEETSEESTQAASENDTSETSSEKEEVRSDETQTDGVKESTQETKESDTASEEEVMSSESRESEVETAEETEQEEKEVQSDITTYANKEVQFSYYVGEVDSQYKIGLCIYNDSSISANGSDGKWQVKSDWEADIFLLTPVENYSGWYQIAISVDGDTASGGFEIYKSADEGVTCENIVTYSQWTNEVVYGKLFESGVTSIAIKEGSTFTSISEAEGEEEIAIKEVESPSITIEAGEAVTYPTEVSVTFNNNTTEKYAVVWDETDKSAVDAATVGEYTVKGTVTCEYTLKDGTAKTETKDVTLTITVNRVASENLLQNPGFEDANYTNNWVTGGSGFTAKKDADPHSGNQALNFNKPTQATVMQTIEGLKAGTYTFGGYIQGGDAAEGDLQYAVVKVYSNGADIENDTPKKEYRESCSLSGWKVWQNPEISNIAVSAGDILVVGVEINASSTGAWGTIDDLYLYAEQITEEPEDPVDGTKDYKNVTVNLNFYVGDLDANAAEEVGFYQWGDSLTIDTAKNPLLTWGGWDNKDTNPVYKMEEVEGHSGWFNITLTANETISFESGKPVSSIGSFAIFRSKEKKTPLIECSGWNGKFPEIYKGLLDGSVTAIRDTNGTMVGYATIAEADEAASQPEEPDEPDQPREWTFEELTALIADADKCNEADYTKASWNTFANALAEAKKITESATKEEIMAAYEALGIAKNVLVNGSLSVAKVALANDFITGADLSSYLSLKNSGVVFKDEEGNELDDAAFFTYLKNGGTNWVRIRIWNNPFDGDGNGYGGGNNDLEAAKTIGKWATDAGMKVLIDFHYSDFWADPGKQKEPKAWANYTVDEKVAAIETFTKDSLDALKAAGVNVGMVQVGNETTNAICGVTLSDWDNSAKIFNAGSKAVRAFDENCLVAIHFTNPERAGTYANFAKNLDSHNVDYDVFASSYYPFWHGTTENLTTQLADIASEYDKKVMVAETSWATTLADQDGHDNTVRKGSNDTSPAYDFSVQGQADELRAVITAVNNVNETAAGKGIGVFYWEPAWMSKNYVYRADGGKNQELLDENKALWEENGSGWAASFAGEYDSKDAGRWFGGSAIDNQSWFDFFGNALPTAKTYSYIRSGETAAEMAITGVKNPTITIDAGGELTYPTEVSVTFNSGDTKKYPVEWDEEDKNAVDTAQAGEYTVKGSVTCEYTLNDGTTKKTETKNVTLTIKVNKVAGENILQNPGFEDGALTPWVVTRKEGAVDDAKVSNANSSNRHSGKWSLHFYNAGIVGFTAAQEVRELAAGSYTFGGYLMGEDKAGGAMEQLAYVEIYGSDGQLKEKKTAKCYLDGWKSTPEEWPNPEITGIEVSKGDYLIVGMEVMTAAGAWGDIDDFYLYADQINEEPEDPVDGDKEYKNVTVNLNFYVGDLDANAAEEVGFYQWGDSLTIDTAQNPLLTWGGWDNKDKNPVYKMEEVEGHSGWFNITLTANETITFTAGKPTKSIGGFSVFRSKDKGTPLISCSGFADSLPEIYKGLLDGSVTAIRDTNGTLVGYATIAEADEAAGKPVEPDEPDEPTEWTFEQLEELIAEADGYEEGNYTKAGWNTFTAALAEAKKITQDASKEEIMAAYEALGIAKNVLVDGSLSVAKIALANDFITGADVSSYLSLRNSGVIFKDEEGNELDDAAFFRYLKNGGTNWIRIRVWNDPFDSEKHGYGGGNNDLEAAKTIGKWATDAGMKVLIDFHYSDFWADPGKQKEPKAWADYTVDEKAAAVETFTKDSLDALKAAGVDVGMVQVGNETTNSICGVTLSDWEDSAKIFNAGSRAVRAFDENCLVAIHFTNPERTGNYANYAKNLDSHNVDYDVFASSYYPFWHGTTQNLTDQLADIAKTYDKKVMVAETSWATTLDDQDGHGDTVRVGSNDKGAAYDFSVQGQADELRAVIKAVNDVNETASGKGIGVFYWEPAWLSKNYVYRADGGVNQELLDENKETWENYGSGWAASFAGEYDAKDAGKWYGGSAVDNQAWFDFFGNALPTAKVYNYIRSGETASEMAITGVKNPSVTIEMGDQVSYPEKVMVSFNDSSNVEYAVSWNAADQRKVDTEKVGEYIVQGTVVCEYKLNNGSTKTETRQVTYTITVKQPVGENLLLNPGFEDGVVTPWTVTAKDGFSYLPNPSSATNDNRHEGKWSLHFWNADAIGFTASQEVRNLEAGSYTFGGFILGDDMADGEKEQFAYVEVYDSEGNLKGERRTAKSAFAGFNAGWVNPEITDIQVAEGDYLIVGMEVETASGGAWGDLDDFYLYGIYDITVDTKIEEGTGSISVGRTHYVAGKKIDITVKPDDGYTLDKLTITGKGIKAETDAAKMMLQSENGTVTQEDGVLTLVYPKDTKTEQKEIFTMPNGAVLVSAVFTEIPGAANADHLKELIATYEKENPENYTRNSWETFLTVLADAKTVAEKADATQAQINTAKNKLEQAYQDLVNIAALKELILQCKDAQQDGYTEESWNVFAQALEDAETIAAKEDATQDEIDDTEYALETAYKSLQLKVTTDFSTLNKQIEACENLNQDAYTEESWRAFSEALAFAKETAANTNATQEEVDMACERLKAAFDGLKVKQDPSEPVTGPDTAELRKLIAAYENLNRDDYTEATWNVFADALAKARETADKTGASQSEIDSARNALQAAFDGLVKYEPPVIEKDGLWAEDIEDIVYTGKALRPDVKVYDGDTLLTQNKDYTLTYRNNTNAGTATIVIKGKGNYADSVEKTFNILKKDLADEDISVSVPAVTAPRNGKSVTPNPQVIRDGVKLKVNKDYVVTSQTYTTPGIYDVEVKAADSGNYTGSRKAEFVVASADQVLMSKVKIKKIPSQKYSAKIEPEVTVTYKGAVLTEGTDYTVRYSNNTQAGQTATVTITGTKVKYVGEKTVSFKITGIALKAKDVQLRNATNLVYTGKAQRPTVTISNLRQNRDYTVEYQNNIDAGTATVIVKGLKGYTGTVRKTFKIAPFDIQKNANRKFRYASNITAPFAKSGSSLTDAKLNAVFSGTRLVQGIDYTLSYKNNKKVGATAEAVIRGRGNFTGTVTTTFKVSRQQLENLTVTASDVIEKNAKKYQKTKLSVMDLDGKALKKGTDYDIVSYTLADDTKIESTPTAGTTVKAVVRGKGSYEGETAAFFRIIADDRNLSKAKITVTPQQYTGEAIKPEAADIKVIIKVNGQIRTLKNSEYEIVGYTNNVKKGTAKITIHGLGEYGGMKTGTFKITARKMKW